MAHEDWHQHLRDARKKLRLSQKAVAAAAGISLDSVRGYESGRRRPSREHVAQICDALQLDRGWRNRLMHAVGYAPDGLDQRPGDIKEWWLSTDEAAAETESYSWPAFVLSERGEVTSANLAAQAVWGVDLTQEFLDPVERNLLSIASNPRFADRCLNWEEALTLILRSFKNYHRASEDPEAPSPYFAAVLEHFLKGDPKYVGRLIELWQKAPDNYRYKIRSTYPIVWEQPGIGVLRFRCLLSTLNESDGLAVNDWIPLDAESWTLLERIKLARGAASSK